MIIKPGLLFKIVVVDILSNVPTTEVIPRSLTIRAYEILMFNSWLSKMHPEAMREVIPDYFKQGRPHVNLQTEGSSLWLRKL